MHNTSKRVDGPNIIQVTLTRSSNHQTLSSMSTFERFQCPLYNDVMHGPNAPLL